MSAEREARDIEARRLDAFVDAAFAFAVTMLLIAGVEPITTLPQLYRALGQIPASAASFVLVVLFWLAHRAYGRMTPLRDTTSTLTSLALVFTVLAYVYPLRMLVDAGFHWGSGRLLPGSVVIDRLSDLRDLYVIYGIGFAILALQVAALFGHAARSADRLGVSELLRAQAASRSTVWIIVASAGVLSALAALLAEGQRVLEGPLLQNAPWLPGVAYWLILVGIQVRVVLARRKTRRLTAGAPPNRP